MQMSWRKDQGKDQFFQKAKEENYRSRAAYKLLEIQAKFRLISRSSVVLDLGCAPGGWLQVVKKLTDAAVYGIDLQAIIPIPGVNFGQFDFFDEEQLAGFIPEEIDAILSDMSPKITGDRTGEHIQSIQMLLSCAELAKNRNAKWFIFKLIAGGREQQVISQLRRDWNISIFKPKASRSESREIYLVCSKK